MGDGKKTLTNSSSQPTTDEEMFKDLDVLLNLEELEESDFWDEMMNLGDLDSGDGAKRGSN
ncbi:MAG: hypothetical protein K0R29_257 [Pseudobdellovibrio sp.]|jgi:hypothetical protein|nr:hypothetical protein [Pseudobdellovibrio sp.]